VADTPYTRPAQVVRKYGPSPSLSPQATPGDPDFVDPYRSSNSVLGRNEAGPSTRPTNYAPLPRVDKVSPGTALATAGNTVVVVQGRFFTGATSVTVGGTAATAVSVIDDETIRCTTPAKAAGTHQVAVVTPNGTSTDTAPAVFA
jgi:hypothetical protein